MQCIFPAVPQSMTLRNQLATHTMLSVVLSCPPREARCKYADMSFAPMCSNHETNQKSQIYDNWRTVCRGRCPKCQSGTENKSLKQVKIWRESNDWSNLGFELCKMLKLMELCIWRLQLALPSANISFVCSVFGLQHYCCFPPDTPFVPVLRQLD